MSTNTGNKPAQHERWFAAAAANARKSSCTRAKCGAVIVKDNILLGHGHNGPPGEHATQRFCGYLTNTSPKPKSDRTCCVHAEWRAIIDALRQRPDAILGATIYFTRVDNDGAVCFSGAPYCTVCSRLALEVGLTHFALWHETGIHVYPTTEYNHYSYAFHSARE